MDTFVNCIHISKEHHNLLLQNNNQPNEVIEICEESEKKIIIKTMNVMMI